MLDSSIIRNLSVDVSTVDEILAESSVVVVSLSNKKYFDFYP